MASRVAWNNRAQAPDNEHIAATIAAVLDCIRQQIAEIDRKIEALIQQSRPLAQAQDCLRTIAGIGPVVAASLLALMPELGSLDRRRVAALAGLAPHLRQSGGMDAYRRTRGGRPEVKTILFMAAMTAARATPQIQEFYQRLVNAGKKPLVALTALMRKIILIANAKIKNLNAQQLS